MYYYSLDGRMCPCDEIAYWAEVCESLRAFPALNVVKIIYSLKNYYFCDVSYWKHFSPSIHSLYLLYLHMGVQEKKMILVEYL